MTKNRCTAPFGYAIEMGRLIEHPCESSIVKQMFADYLAGASLKDIAEELTAHQIEFLPGKSTWNKNRIKRILEDARYLGEGQFSALVDEVAFRAVQARKQERNDRKAIQAESHVSQVTVPVVCAACGKAMTRTHHTNRKIADVWECTCGKRISILDCDLLREITVVMNRLIADPALITEKPQEPNDTQQLEIRRLQNEISRHLEGFDFDRDAVQNKIFELAAAKFESLPDHTTTQMVRAAFERSAPINNFPRELLEATVRQVLLDDDGVSLRLKNHQIIGKDGENAGNNSIGENCT